jgi:tetratricopeptide (TPR) repeat protein
MNVRLTADWEYVMRRRLCSTATALSAAVAAVSTTVLFVAPGLAEWTYAPSGNENRTKAYVVYQKAMEAFKAGDNNTCLALCKAALNFDHANKHIVHLMALAYSQAGDNYNAMLQFRAALTLDYNFLPCRNNYGLFLKKTGKAEEAKKMFEECIRIDPKYPDAYYNLGTILREKADLDRAIECFETATRLNPRYFDAQRDLGLTIFERAEQGGGGEMKDSMAALQKAAQLAPNNPLIWYHLGYVDCSEGKLDDAETMFRNSLMRDPKLAVGHWELGRLRYLRGDPDRCMSEIQVAKKISPVFTDDHKYPKVDLLQMNLMLASCFEVKGMMEEAVDTYKEAAGMQRQNGETLRHIADIEKQLHAKVHHKGKAPPFDLQEVQALLSKGISQTEDGDIDGAKHTFLRALELNPNSFEATQYLGGLLEAAGDLNGAIAKYQAAMALKPSFEGAYYNMAYVLEKANLPSDAGAMYQKFHELAGRYPYDPKHIVSLQQEDVRERARQEQIKKRGY